MSKIDLSDEAVIISKDEMLNLHHVAVEARINYQQSLGATPRRVDHAEEAFLTQISRLYALLTRLSLSLNRAREEALADPDHAEYQRVVKGVANLSREGAAGKRELLLAAIMVFLENRRSLSPAPPEERR